MTGTRRRRVAVVAASMATATALLVGAGARPPPAVAECDGPIPSFRKAVTTAARIVIGDVVGVDAGGRIEPATSDGWSSRFTLRVRYVPLGAARDVIEIRDLATQPCAPVVQVRLGDRVAIAFEATDYDPPIEVNSVAWISEQRPDGVWFESTSVDEVYGLLGLNPPETSTVLDESSATDGLPGVLAWVAGVAAAWLGLRWRLARG